MKSIKIFSLLILLFCFLSVSAQQSNSELQKQADPVVEQTVPDQVPANQPPAGQVQEVQESPVTIDQSTTKTSGPAANEEGSNTMNPTENSGMQAVLQDDTQQTAYTGPAANQDPNEVSPIDK